MKRVLDCTRCKYFISCEPGKLAFATYYGCREYEEKEGNGKMKNETKLYEVKVSDFGTTPEWRSRFSNVAIIGFDENHVMTVANYYNPKSLDENEKLKFKKACEGIIDSLEMLAENAECKMFKICKFTTEAVNSPYKDTVEGMLSPDYKERFKAEYQQTKIRYEKLKAFCNRIEAAITTSHEGKKVDMPAHDCPYELLRTQQGHMGLYLHDLEIRAVIEGIEL